MADRDADHPSRNQLRTTPLQIGGVGNMQMEAMRPDVIVLTISCVVVD